MMKVVPNIAFSHHLTCSQVYGDSRVPTSDVVSGLVQPVVGGKADMAVAEYSDKVRRDSHTLYGCGSW